MSRTAESLTKPTAPNRVKIVAITSPLCATSSGFAPISCSTTTAGFGEACTSSNRSTKIPRSVGDICEIVSTCAVTA